MLGSITLRAAGCMFAGFIRTVCRIFRRSTLMTEFLNQNSAIVFAVLVVIFSWCPGDGNWLLGLSDHVRYVWNSAYDENLSSTASHSRYDVVACSPAASTAMLISLAVSTLPFRRLRELRIFSCRKHLVESARRRLKASCWLKASLVRGVTAFSTASWSGN